MKPEKCREFNIKYCKEMVEKSMKNMVVTGVNYHLCGDHGKDWPLHDVPTPPGSIMHVTYDGLKPADLTEVVKVFGNKCPLLGNIDTALIARGTPAQIYEQTKKDVLKYKGFPKGFVAGLACECPPFVPPANVMAFMKAVNDYGKY
ncbi:MAG: uroporphyrinogen decarboxylase family protein [Nitrososphaerota archaeon]